MTHSILIVDDDPEIRQVLRIGLTQAGFETQEAGDGAEGLAKATSGRFDLVILDIGLPRMDGLEVCRVLRQTHATPILFLTARDDEIDRVLGFELGGDDYVTKPFSPRELAARVKAILKRTGRQAQSTALQRGSLTVDEACHLCEISGVSLSLTAREMALLVHLMRQPDHVSGRPALTDAMYGANIHVSDRTVDSHLRNLRTKLASAGCADAIETVHGVGVRMGLCSA
jgi:two-component system OmpR family response regulator|tara:strand:- start:1317 stop:2000 length:684 start_codon:yes stop_codon:yes gene_type:complete